jgi:hypothetical protein
MQTQTQTIQANPVNPANILDQFSEMLKTHSIVVPDRDNLLRLFENIVDLCTQMPKTKLKAAIKAATPKPVPEPKKKPVAAKKPAAAKKSVAATEELVGPADAGDCPVLSDLSDLSKAPRGRGRPRKESSSSPVQSESSVNDAEKKKRGRPKKDKTVVVSSNEDEDALIAKMISDMKTLQSTTPVAIADPDEEVEQSEQSEQSMSPVYTAVQSQLAPVVVEADVVEEKETNAKSKSKSKSAKEPKPKPAKEVKPKPAKEVKSKPAKEAKTKTNDNSASQDAPAESATPATPASPAPTSAAPTSSVPPRENKAQSDGKFYLMSGFPRVSFTYNGATYLRTETDNVYDPLTMELVGVWDHLNHEIIVAFDEEEGDIWMSDEE